MKVQLNILRLKYLLDLYKLSKIEFLQLINSSLKKPIAEKDIFTTEIELNYLKKIDKIFNKGLSYYTDPKNPIVSEEASIFFRKRTFDIELNLSARKVVNQFEELKISLSAIAKMAEVNLERNIPDYSIHDDPKSVSKIIREILYPSFHSNKRTFLKALISQFADKKILVFEFVETWNKKEKANIEGFFIAPNVIVLQRLQNSLRREIFTLAHELGHFLLNDEEIDKLNDEDIVRSDLSIKEKWCNEFAYFFLIGSYDSEIDSIVKADSNNNYQLRRIKLISDKTHLSQMALLTRLLFLNKISVLDYNEVKFRFEESARKKEEEEKQLSDLTKQQGIIQKGSTPQPIKSPLFVSTIQKAFYEGIINEYEVCKTLNIKPDKLQFYIP